MTTQWHGDGTVNCGNASMTQCSCNDYGKNNDTMAYGNYGNNSMATVATKMRVLVTLLTMAAAAADNKTTTATATQRQ